MGLRKLQGRFASFPIKTNFPLVLLFAGLRATYGAQ